MENISALAEQLKVLGFEDAGYALLKRICFKPEKFILTQNNWLKVVWNSCLTVT